MQDKCILIKGARQHNLKNITVRIPRDKLVVITGISGSGKSSLAFDTLYAEGQRKYVESLSAYARQFLEQMQKPDVDSIEGLPPTIAIEQRKGHTTPRSTVATSTEIYDYLRLLYARIGKPYCYKCGKQISKQTPQQIVDSILQLPQGSKIIILAPVVSGKKGAHKEIVEEIKKSGFVRIRVDGQIIDIQEFEPLDKNKKHEIEIVVDRLSIAEPAEIKQRLTESIELSLKAGKGKVLIMHQEGSKQKLILYSEENACSTCGVSYGEIQPRLFSFNSPYGACEGCGGLGTKLTLDEDLVVPDKSKSIRDWAIEPLKRVGKRSTIHYYYMLRDFCSDFGIDFYETPFYKIPSEIKRILLYGTRDEDVRKYGQEFEGVIPHLISRFENTSSDFVKERIMAYMSEAPCRVCQGARLKKEALSIKVGGLNIHQLTQMTIERALEFFNNLQLTKEEENIAYHTLKEIRNRLSFLVDVGVGYLTLDRKSETLAGGEAQRIKLASQVGSGLVGVCYVLDEPTIGLHQRDNQKLLNTLCRLRDLGNTVVVVEHDEDMIKAADWLIDMGPGAGLQGGYIVSEGSLEDVKRQSKSFTGKFFTGKLTISVPKRRRQINRERVIEVVGACENNLKNINVEFPLGVFICVTGVSGSGKSSLVEEVLYKGLRRLIYKTKEKPGQYEKIIGWQYIDRVIIVDQSPIGRTSRSNPATYTNVFTEIRKIFASTKEARARGYTPGRFSFNVKGGRCEACEGHGVKIVEMHFLPDIAVVCEQCQGQRYNRETLEIRYRGKNIAEILDTPVDEALKIFENHPQIVRILKTLYDVGLSYIKLGQPSPTLSGGEAQRVKLAAELCRPPMGHTLYILDEPTVGLHYADISKLLNVLERLVNIGNTVIVIEHNMHVIKVADYIIDLGPEGGERGGRVVACGTPEVVAQNPESYTGKILSAYLNSGAS